MTNQLTFLQKFENYLKASYPALYVQTHEEKRLLQDLLPLTEVKAGDEAGAAYTIYTWNLSEGIRNLRTGELLGADTAVPSDVPVHIMKIPRLQNAIFLMYDFHLVIDKPLVIRRFRNLWDNLKARGSMIVFTGCKLVLPAELEKEVQLLDYNLPQVEAIGERLQFIIDSANHQRLEEKLEALEISSEVFDSAVQAAKGMTFSEIENTFALAAITAKGFNNTFVEHVFEEKITQFKKSGLLTYIPSDLGFESVGGLSGLKTWLRGRKKAYSKEAKNYGLPLPKGCLFCSVPGVGKTMLAKATAREFDCPLFSFDIGNIFDSHVGNSERNMREAIKTIESIGKCVILIDEIEKALSENAVSGRGDTGVSSRIYGTFLSWLNDRTNPAFIIATSNNHTILPTPLIRKGRFDQLFWIDLPTEEERMEIWNVVIKKYGREPENFNVFRLRDNTEDYTGAEIEELFKSALFKAYDNQEEVDEEHVVNETKLFIPFAKSHVEDLETMRAQAQGKLVMLTDAGEAENVEDGMRKLRI